MEFLMVQQFKQFCLSFLFSHYHSGISNLIYKDTEGLFILLCLMGF